MKHELFGSWLTLVLTTDLSSVTVTALQREAMELIAQNKPSKITVRFENVSMIDSQGLNLLLVLYKKSLAMNCEFDVANISDLHRDLFEKTGLSRILSN